MNNDQLSSGILLIVGLSICVGSLPYKLGTLSYPGSGFMPFLSGVVIVFCSGVGFIHATMRRRQGERWSSLLQGLHWKRALVVLVSLLAYVLLLEPFGFFLCTALFVGFLLRVIVPYRWSVVIGGALLIAIASYGIFEIWLQAQLPKGPLGV